MGPFGPDLLGKQETEKNKNDRKVWDKIMYFRFRTASAKKNLGFGTPPNKEDTLIKMTFPIKSYISQKKKCHEISGQSK